MSRAVVPVSVKTAMHCTGSTSAALQTASLTASATLKRHKRRRRSASRGTLSASRMSDWANTLV